MLARLKPDELFAAGAEAYGHDSESTLGDAAAPVLGMAVETDTTFWAEAVCNDGGGSLAGLFFSDELQDIAAAKRICATCPVIEQCLEGAVGRKEPWGVWGGQLFSGGMILTAKRRRGRPPKSPRVEDEFLHIPVPDSLREVVALRTA